MGKDNEENHIVKAFFSATDEELAKNRKEIHADHLDYFYGDNWCIFIDKESACFITFDVGHFISEFITQEISYDDYNSLKKDKSLFSKIKKFLC